MQVLQLLFNNFWLVVLFFFLFGGSIWEALRRILKHRERMQELRNEELRLQLQLAQENKKKSTQDFSYASTPKEANREEYESPLYETGYQQQSQ
jgi:hypothetical protein